MGQVRSKASRTELENLGEFGLIDRLTGDYKLVNKSSLLGVGDDAAVIAPDQSLQLVSSDMLLEGIHFDLTYCPLKHLGYKAIAVNVSDIAAMNGHCQQVTVNIGLSNRFSLEAVEELYQGIYQACASYGCDLVGGDTTSSLTGLTISVTAIGSVATDKLVKRSGAQEFDLICVSGDLGAAYMGLQVLEREKQVFLTNKEMQPELEAYQYIVGRQLRAEARIDVVQWLEGADILPHSMIDVSDGLASDLLHLCRQSECGLRIYEDKIPVHPATKDAALEFKLSPTTVSLHGGEDYELLFTVDQKYHQQVEQQPGISIIGHITENSQGIKLVSANEELVDIQAQGWKHF